MTSSAFEVAAIHIYIATADNLMVAGDSPTVAVGKYAVADRQVEAASAEEPASLTDYYNSHKI